MANCAIFYGSTTGNTKDAAKTLRQLLGEEAVDLIDVSNADPEKMLAYPYLIWGSSTWGSGDLQDDWEAFLAELNGTDLSGKKIAFFGLGDQEGYPDEFVDAMGILYETAVQKGATPVGSWPTEGYIYDHSKAVVDGQFVGLALDEDNQSDQSDERLKTWAETLHRQFGF